MGFMDKAKKLADQAQAKLDEVQKQFNESQGSSAPQQGGPAVEYDQHGRPVQRDTERPQGDPLGASSPPAPADKAPHVVEEAGDPEKPQGDPLREAAAQSQQPPKPPAPGSGLTSGDPLAG
jgi:hypothetical protein